MIAWLTIIGIALIPIAIIALVLALIAAMLATLAERDLGEGLFADRDV